MAEIQMAALGPFEYSHYTQGIEGEPRDPSAFLPQVVKGGEWSSSVMEVQFPLGLDFGQTQAVTIPRSGDLLGECYMQVTLPVLSETSGRWVDGVGYALFEQITLTLDGNVLHDHSQVWTDMRDRLLLPLEKRAAIDDMIGRGRRLDVREEHTLFIPFDWFFSLSFRKINQKLPIGAMSSSTMLLTVRMRQLQDLIIFDDVTDATEIASPVGSLGNPTLLLTYYLITPEERLAMMVSDSTLLVEQVQEVQAENHSVDSGTWDRDVVPSVSVPLPFTRLTKCIAWVGQSESASQPFEYSDCFSNVTLTSGAVQAFPTESSRGLSYKQSFQYCNTSRAEDPLGVYSFSLCPSALQPSGLSDFRNISSPILRLGFDTSNLQPTTVTVCALTYNLLVVGSQRAYLLYA